ncbi:MAG: alpha/beta hydrolase [Clostridia bacterium]|nr:alpha/beta hydrolase [Clostridia bacterium]
MTKKLLKGAAIGTSAVAGVLGLFSTVVYECMLNIRLAGKIGEKFSPAVTDEPETLNDAKSNPSEINAEALKVQAEKKAQREEEEKALSEENARFNEAVSAWLSVHKASDLYIENENKVKRHAKFFNNGHPEKWAIIFHGFTSAPPGMYHYAYTYGEMGFNCILPSMIGHGDDTNRYCSMGYHDRYMGIDWIKYIVSLYPDAEIVLHGESMGAATTMLITGEELPSNVKCAVADCGFTNCLEEYKHVAKNQMTPAMVPLLSVLSLYSELRGNFNFKKCSPVDAVKKSVTPTLFVHGERDDFVPFRMLNELYSACNAPKEYFTVKNAAHAESSTKSPRLYWTNVSEFLKKHVSSW